MNILAIETSCDETALSIITINKEENNFSVLSDLVISQIPIHKEYGGVFPALAKREHAKNLTPLLKQALIESDLFIAQNKKSHVDYHEIETLLSREPELFSSLKTLDTSIEKPNINMIMVTHGPGLAPALWVGVNFARALSLLWNIPIIPVNHMEGHITSVLLKPDYSHQTNALENFENFEFPMLALLISGGHTQLVLVKNWGQYTIIGETIDDAVGEAFDKVARMLDLEYPGGPKISKKAEQGMENDSVKLPRPMINSKDYRFSFSGLKTAARYLIDDLKKEGTFNEQYIADISREFEHAVTDVLVKKTCAAIEEFNVQGLIIAGGVSANKFITNTLRVKMEEYQIPLYLPQQNLCGDNSLMIATAGFIQNLKNKKTAIVPQNEIIAVGNLKL